MNYLEKVREKKIERGQLDSRWQVDEDLLYLKRYIMGDAKIPPKAIPDIVNVTLNLPGRFANDVISTLGTAREQSIVETEDKNLDTTEIEDFRRAGFGAANARLRLQGRFELNPWWDFHSCIRGGAAARCLFRMEKKVLIPDITPWDIRYVSYDIGDKGLDWAAYETTRPKGVIGTEYEAEIKRYGISVPDKGGSVLDVWDTEHNEVWIEGTKVKEQKHKFGFCPIVIQFVVLGSMLVGEDSLAHKGEGIFFLIRDAVPELERLVSIMQTLNLKIVKPPVQYKSDQGVQATAPDYEGEEGAMAMGAITPVDKGGGIERIDFGDAQRSAELAYRITQESIREATVAASDLGIIESPPASGVRAMVAGESRDQLLSPRLGLKALMNQGLADMFTAQVVQMGGSVELGTLGHKRKFQTSKLDGQYEGYYKYTIKSAAVDAGRASLAAAYGDDLSWRTKAEQIWMLEDVDGENRQRNIEAAERLFPSIKARRILVSLVEEGRDEEAELASAEMGVNLQQMMAGEMAPPKPEPEQEPKQVLSLFGGGQGRQQTPKEEE